MAEVHVEGLSDVARRMRELTPRLARKGLGAAVREGALIVRAEARSLAPVYTGEVSQGHPPPGTLRKSVILKYIAEKSSREQVTYYVLVRSGKRYQAVQRRRKGQTYTVNMDAFYWRFVEFGTKNMEARPFMRPAFENKKMAALNAIANKLRDGVEQTVREMR